MKRPLKLDRLRASQGQVRIIPVKSLEETLVPLQDDVEYWGFYTTPSKAEMAHWAGEEWRREVGKLPMLEVRVCGGGLDLHWWEGSGTVLRAAEARPTQRTSKSPWAWAERDGSNETVDPASGGSGSKVETPGTKSASPVDSNIRDSSPGWDIDSPFCTTETTSVPGWWSSFVICR